VPVQVALLTAPLPHAPSACWPCWAM
jgi:hypothetical protein